MNLFQKNEPFYPNFIEALKILRTTETETPGVTRAFTRIDKGEFSDIQVQDFHVLTEEGEIPLSAYDPESTMFVIKRGEINITPQTPKEDIVKAIAIDYGQRWNPEDIALSERDITENTKVFVEDITVDILQQLPQHTTDFYDSYLMKHLNLSYLTSAEGLTFPQTVHGDIDLRGLTSAEDLTLP